MGYQNTTAFIFDLRKKRELFRAICIVALLCVPLFLSYTSKSRFESLKETGVLRVASVNSPTIYYLEKGEPAGFEYELTQAFADHHGLALQFDIYPNKPDALAALNSRDADISAAQIIATPARAADYSFAPAYLNTTSSLIYRITQGLQPPKSIEDILEKTLMLPESSPHLPLLESLKTEHPSLSWQTTDTLSDYEVLEKVQAREVDLSVMDTLLFDTFSPYLPGINIAFELDEPQPIGWAYLPHPDASFTQALNDFFALEETQSLISSLKIKYFSQQNPLGFFDTQTFNSHIKSRLPVLLPDFIEAQQTTGIDWHLLAAIAYQESHWNPRAVSPTGVRGIMMLTRATAKEMGVKDRTNPSESIRGGSAYFKKIFERMPERIQGEDRIWLALASYNIGYGHLEDARILTQRAGQDPNKWDDVKAFLPKLTQEKYYKTVKRGYARGHEPVQYVGNIQKYIELIKWHEQVAQMQQSEASPLALSAQHGDTPAEANDTETAIADAQTQPASQGEKLKNQTLTDPTTEPLASGPNAQGVTASEGTNSQTADEKVAQTVLAATDTEVTQGAATEGSNGVGEAKEGGTAGEPSEESKAIETPEDTVPETPTLPLAL